MNYSLPMPEILVRLLVLLLLFYPYCSGCQERMPETVDIRIFTNHELTSLKVIPAAGAYVLTGPSGEMLLEARENDIIEFRALGRHAGITLNDTTVYVDGQVTMKGKGFENFFLIRPHGYSGQFRTYDDDLKIGSQNGELILVNSVSFEKYIAGVVHAESGWFRHPEFYEVQAIIARTFAMRSLFRHASEGYQLCDRVHCQAFYGKTNYPEVIKAVWNTKGDVVVDQNNRLIESVYHANCGGQTVNSEDLWPQALPYLRSVEDPYCGEKPGATWQADISGEDFIEFLHGFQSDSLEIQPSFVFSQSTRRHFLDDTNLIHLRHMRSFFGLRSTFFSFFNDHDILHVHGRGYGHGVGLCQEGAMAMAELGYDADSIIGFYYQGVRIISLDEMFGDVSHW